MSLKENYDFEHSAWENGRDSLSSAPRYILDTVLHHETNTDALYKAMRGLELAKDKTVCELGCNAGGFCFLFAKTAKKVLGIDLLKEPLEYAEKFKIWLNERNFDEILWGEKWCHPSDWDVSNVYFMQGNAYDLPPINEKFDVVFMYSCIEHFPKHERENSIREAMKILKDDGLIVISTSTDVDNENREEWIKEINEKAHIFGLCSLEDINTYIKNIGLEVIEENEIWFGDENKIKLAFVVIKKNVRN